MRSDTHDIESSPDSDVAPGPQTRPRRKRRLRSVLGGLLLFAAIVAVLGLSLLASLRHIRGDLVRGRSAAEHGRSELLAGDAVAAAESLRDARESFARAAGRTDGLLFRVAGWLPIVGRTTDAVEAVAGSAVDATDAVIVLADAAADIPGPGLSGLAPSDGRVPLDRFPPLIQAAGEADALMTRAVTRLDEAPTSLLLGPVGPARLDAQTQLDELGRSVHATHLLLQGLPRFLGAEGRQRYFFGAQDPAELRGTGGLIGAYSILTTDDGRFHFTPFLPIHGLTPPPAGSVPSPNHDFRANYDQFRVGGRFWTSINVMPDMPTVGQAILSSYEAVTGDRLDGVILADPFAEEALLKATGPVGIPGYDIEIVVPFTTNEAFAVFTDSAMRKRILGDVARVVFERFVSQEAADHLDLEQLVQAAADRHILMFSSDPSMQEGLRATPVGGALRPPGSDGDLLSVVVNSAAGSKVDFYQDRDLRYAIDLRNDGFGVADLDVTLHNDAPTSGQPGYVIGPAHAEDGGSVLEHLRAGESVALINAYCGTDCVPVARREGDGPLRTVGSKTDLGVRYEQRYVPIRSGQEHTFEFSWADPSAWEGNSSGGVYRLTFANQVTVRPTTLHLRIEPPEGMRIVSASAPLRIVQGAAVYEGQPGSRLDLTVEFAPPLPVRLWRDVTRFL